MPHRVCPWWLGYLLASPLRRLFSESPRALLAPYVRAGMTVLEPGPGMGYFTIELARLVGASGKVIAVDVQPRMLEGLRRRATRAGVVERIAMRLATPESLEIGDLAGEVDFVLAFAMVHEMPSAEAFFAQIAAACKAGAQVLLAEPSGHVDPGKFDTELREANAAGLEVIGRPQVRHAQAALLRKAR